MSDTILYLDYAATTPVDPAVLDEMSKCSGLDGVFANPSSTHPLGLAAKTMVEHARAQIAERVGAQPDEIVFTSGATESNNLALKGTLLGPDATKERLITTRIEHKSIIDTAKFLAKSGIEVRHLATDSTGRIALDDLDRVLEAESPALVSIMHVNNEIGAIQDVETIAGVVRQHGGTMHVDAAQSVGKVPLRLNDWRIDLCSLTAHKICGPKGVGALYVRRGTALEPMMHGGEQERGLRAGTLPTHQIVGMGKAYELADPAADQVRMTALRDRLLSGLLGIGGVRQNGSADAGIPNITNVCFPGVDGESLRLALSDLAVSAGSACNSDVPEPSYVLTALGLSDALANSSIRFSFGRFTTSDEIDYAVSRVRDEVQRLRRLSGEAPAWCSA